ncbi:MAG: hypothetical protein ACFFGZ_07120, partial [Candidatus Thorarchaeota archaeon]
TSLPMNPRPSTLVVICRKRSQKPRLSYKLVFRNTIQARIAPGIPRKTRFVPFDPGNWTFLELFLIGRAVHNQSLYMSLFLFL